MQDFASNYVNFGQEGWCPVQFSLANGGFLIFNRKDGGVFDYMAKLARFQDKCRGIGRNSKRVRFKCKNGRDDVTYNLPLWPEYGTQFVLNLAYLMNDRELVSGMNFIPSGVL